MPLHGVGKTLRAFHTKGFNQAVRRMRHSAQTICQPVHALAVQGIHPRRRTAGPVRERTAGHQVHLVRQAILVVIREFGVFAVVGHTVHMVHLLVQRAPHGHIDFLETPANPQQGYAVRNAGAHEWQGQAVAVRVQRQTRIGDVFPKMRGMHIGRRTREQDAVHHGQHSRQRVALGCREQDRFGTRCLLERQRIFFSQHIEGRTFSVFPQITPVYRQPDQNRRLLHHALSRKRWFQCVTAYPASGNRPCPAPGWGCAAGCPRGNRGAASAQTGQSARPVLQSPAPPSARPARSAPPHGH